MLTQDKSQISLRLPTDLVSEYDRIATALDRDRTWVMLRALTQYLEQEGAELLQDAEGFAELEEGKSADLDDVLSKASSIIEAAEAKRSKRAG
ncbi:CopG family ribbon-helix-helix protein [Neorhizobium tomejilense]|uniref:CopG family ribbon-helix-helix protein n=1 Tax=Neorhizobium tomejilense TaxID=2093828 RepID=UPI000CFA5BC7|nr:ribbon-helix-helix protein, CopG family [Neorhizobium tomejilense]